RLHPLPTLFPYTTLFRSPPGEGKASKHSWPRAASCGSAAHVSGVLVLAPRRRLLFCSDRVLVAHSQETSAYAHVPPWCALPPRRSEEHTSELQSRFDLVC